MYLITFHHSIRQLSYHYYSSILKVHCGGFPVNMQSLCLSIVCVLHADCMYFLIELVQS